MWPGQCCHTQRVQWYVSMGIRWIHEQTEKNEETWRKIFFHCCSFTMNPHRVMQDSTAAIQSADSTKMHDIRIQQYSLLMQEHVTRTAITVLCFGCQ